MAALPMKVMVPGGASIALVAAAGGGDTCPAGDGVFLEANNGSGAPITVTLVTPGLYQGLAIADQPSIIPAGERWQIPVPRLFAAADGLCSITYSGVTTLTVGCFKYAS